MKRILVVFVWLFILNNSYAQDLIVKVFDDQTNQKLSKAYVNYEGKTWITDNQGQAVILVDKSRPIILKVTLEGYKEFQMAINDAEKMPFCTIQMKKSSDNLQNTDRSNIIILDQDDLQSDELETGVSSLLRSSKDPFLSAAAFNFFVARFRMRGYDNDQTENFLNGLPTKTLYNNRIPFGFWGGLNDAMRISTFTLGMDHSEFMFGNIGGGSNVNLGALSQRKQVKASYAISNRSYRNRIMLTYSTGEMENGWAFTLSGSRRWAKQGYVEGTFYDAYSYLASIEKRINRNHSVGLVVLGAPRKTGRSSGSVNEMYELSNNRYYNPNYGFQNGKIRNSRYWNTHQPIVNLNHKGKVGALSFTNSFGLITGKTGSGRLDWYSAPDPRPDYYRKLPSYYEGTTAEAIAKNMRDDIANRQLNWDFLYDVNKLHKQTIHNVDGDPNKSFTGLRSLYAQQEEHSDVQRYIYNGTAKYKFNDRMEMNFGLTGQKEKVHFYREMVDLLGGEFWLDVDQFAERENPSDPNVIQTDLNQPNRIIKEGDLYGYNYESHATNASGWVGFLARLNRLDFNLGAKVTYDAFYRNGLFKDGNFPEESFGKSKVVQFISPAAKAGVNVKLNGRNYIYTNVTYQQQAPYFRNTFLSNRTRNATIKDPKTEKIMSGELAYVHRSPKWSFKALGYYTDFKDLVELDAFYLDGTNSFVNYILSDVGKTHRGIELSSEYKLTSTLTLKTVAGIGQHFYNKRPSLNIVPDLGPAIDLGDRAGQQVVYIKNYRVPGPQTAAMAGLTYRSPKYWFMSVSFNYFDNNHLDFNPDRRTEYSVKNINKETQESLFYNTIRQTKLPANYTLDFFGGWSKKIKQHFIYLNVGVNNILNNRDFISGGFEQSRLGFRENSATQADLDKFPNRYFYGYGTNYFISITYKF